MKGDSIVNLKQGLYDLEDEIIYCENKLCDIPVEWANLNPDWKSESPKEIGMLVHLIQRRLGTMKDCMNAIDDIVRYLEDKFESLES